MELTNPSVIRSLSEKYGFGFSKTLGQNFLINKAIPVKIAEAALPEKGGTVFEIGTGIGCLTKELSKRADRVIAFEIDRSLEPILKETLSECDNIEIIFTDFLKADLQTICKERGIERFSVCANLPYYITTPIMMSILESNLNVHSITVMVQKELARRFCTMPGTPEYGSVTASIAYYSRIRNLFTVSSGSFLPAPKVDSAVIRLDIIPENERITVRSKETFFRVIRSAFAMRRKTLVNNISAEFSITKKEAAEAVASAGISIDARGETLDLTAFARLSDCLFS